MRADTIPRMTSSLRIGFVGQGYVGGSYANNFESRGLDIVRYSLEPQHVGNKEKISECDIVFVCVPTPTTPKGFDMSIIEAGLKLVGAGKTAVIKSTLLPGTTKKLQKKFPRITVLCSPEFLSVVSAQRDADHPFSNILGISIDNAQQRAAAEAVLSVLPEAPFSTIVSSEQAELIKYAHNVSGYMQILTFNTLFDIAKNVRADWAPIQEAIDADPMVCNRYSNPIHKSGRGAGGACFIKDMAAFSRLYRATLGKNKTAIALLSAAEKLNIALLASTEKDLDLLRGVYGNKVVSARKANKKSAKKSRR